MKMKTRISMTLLLAVAFFLFAVVSAQALKLPFYNITNNNSVDAAIGEAQLWVEVEDGGGCGGTARALFTFGNDGLAPSSICDVYFDDGSLLGIHSIDDSITAGVSFSAGASPGNLPGANNISPSFVTTAGFSADSDEPAVQQNGVNPGEELGICFNLQDGRTYTDVIDELGTGELRIGIHVQGFASGGSESFVTVPEPATIVLFGTGLIGLAGLGRKKFFKQN